MASRLTSYAEHSPLDTLHNIINEVWIVVLAQSEQRGICAQNRCLVRFVRLVTRDTRACCVVAGPSGSSVIEAVEVRE